MPDDLFAAQSDDELSRLAAAGWTEYRHKGERLWRSPEGRTGFTEAQALARLEKDYGPEGAD
jgi:hypothetical protein